MNALSRKIESRQIALTLARHGHKRSAEFIKAVAEYCNARRQYEHERRIASIYAAELEAINNGIREGMRKSSKIIEYGAALLVIIMVAGTLLALIAAAMVK